MANGLDTVYSIDMDVDMDIDLGPIDDFQDGNINQLDSDQPTLSTTQNQSNGTEVVQQPSIGSETEPSPQKVHIRGLDNLTTEDIRTFSAEHFRSNSLTRVEWIDDTSANIVFDDEATALVALEKFSLVSEIDGVPIPSLQLRAAKPLSTHPDSSLQVRTAVTTDQKPPRAHARSRFYMMHPEYDPRERRRRGERSPYRDNSDYRRRHYDDKEHRRRRRNDDDGAFDASMYDDRRPLSRRDSIISSLDSRSEEGTKGLRSRSKSYRPSRRDRDGTSRERSASPVRQQRTPPPLYRIRDPHPFPHENKGKELFPTKSGVSGELSRTEKDLYSNKMLAVGLKKELFPHKTNLSNHRRSDAFDAADETADLFKNGLFVSNKEKSTVGKSLADRITNGPTLSYGRLKPYDPEPADTTQDVKDVGIIIRGASSQQDQGFSIRGNAAAGTIKELFPGKKIGNSGKELFAERLQGRGGRRAKAEDLFY